ncbi:DM13 domain-containing protein [Ferruginibacter sp.]|nr:DM13 domain-containing protein [Ferruginibacter sp.]
MRKLIISFSATLFFFASCKKESSTPAVINDPLPVTITTLASGSFVTGAHASSGTAKIVKDAANKIYLVVENFKTDGGPDLRIWLSPNNNASPYQEVGLLKATSGKFSYELDATFNYITNNRVLIWCKQFSVLFGYAVLQ